MRDLIFVSLEPWDEIWRRNQFLCAELARRFPDQRILFVERPLFWPLLLRSFLRSRSGASLRLLRRTLRDRFRPLPGFPNICVYTPLKWLPNPLPGGKKSNDWSMTRGIAAAAQAAGVRDPLLWLNPHDAGFLIDHLGERGVIYDITDDWELAAPSGPEREQIAGQDRALCRRADLTVVCSQALFDSRDNIARRLLLLPNGVNAEHYARAEQDDPRPPGLFSPDGSFTPVTTTTPTLTPTTATTGETPKTATKTPTTPTTGETSTTSTPTPTTTTEGIAGTQWPRPVFGYTGSLHRERVDLELVEELAKQFPHGSVVLVGPQHWSDDSLASALQKHPNLHAPGAVAYASIPDVMARFDVCIVPHLQSGFVESLNPIKLWEFLACGKPIVATDVAGFRDFPHLVRLAKDSPAFVEACRAALQEVNACSTSTTSTNRATTTPTKTDNPTATNHDMPRCLAKNRQREAKNHSWSGRVDDLLAGLRVAGLIHEEAHDGQSTTEEVR